MAVIRACEPARDRAPQRWVGGTSGLLDPLVEALRRYVMAADKLHDCRTGLARRHVGPNYLFAGSDAGGERAAVIYTLIGTAKLNGLDPEAYLREVLTRIADHLNRIDELLLWEIGPLRQEAEHAA